MCFVYHDIDMQSVQEFFVENINNPIIATLIIAILPIFELRGAIPFGMSTLLWGSRALSCGIAFLVGFLGSSAVVPILALVFRPILSWLKNTKLFSRLANNFEESIKSKGSKVSLKESRIKKMLALTIFVGVPLPLTGVYTGTMIGVIVGLSFMDILISVIGGNLIAGIIITSLSMLSENAANWILIIFISMLVVILSITILKKLFKDIKIKSSRAE